MHWLFLEQFIIETIICTTILFITLKKDISNFNNKIKINSIAPFSLLAWLCLLAFEAGYDFKSNLLVFSRDMFLCIAAYIVVYFSSLNSNFESNYSLKQALNNGSLIGSSDSSSRKTIFPKVPRKLFISIRNKLIALFSSAFVFKVIVQSGFFHKSMAYINSVYGDSTILHFLGSNKYIYLWSYVIWGVFTYFVLSIAESVCNSQGIAMDNRIIDHIKRDAQNTLAMNNYFLILATPPSMLFLSKILMSMFLVHIMAYYLSIHIAFYLFRSMFSGLNEPN